MGILLTPTLRKRNATRWDAFLDGQLVGVVERVALRYRTTTPPKGKTIRPQLLNDRGLIVTTTGRLKCRWLDGAVLDDARTLAHARELFATTRRDADERPESTEVPQLRRAG